MPELPELDNILHSGALAYGKWGKEFEKRLAEYLGVKNVLLTNTYGLAWQVLFRALGLEPGDEVIATPMSCLQSTMPMAQYGLKTVWADIDPKYGVLDPDSVKCKITAKTKVIINYHFCGYPGYVDEINAIGKEKGIMVIDDCIEAFGAKYKGKRLGNVETPISRQFAYQILLKVVLLSLRMMNFITKPLLFVTLVLTDPSFVMLMEKYRKIATSLFQA